VLRQEPNRWFNQEMAGSSKNLPRHCLNPPPGWRMRTQVMLWRRTVREDVSLGRRHAERAMAVVVFAPRQQFHEG